MTTWARVAFAALVCATFGAFFVTQRLKRTPPVVQRVMITPLFSPNQDGRFERATIRFLLKERDDVTVDVVDTDDDRVRRLASSRALPSYKTLRLRWDGRDDAGRRAPDGTYRVRVGLRREGRSILLPKRIRLDTTPPEPRVVSIGPGKTLVPRPELLPRRDGRPARAQLFLPGRRPSVLVYRTDLPAPRLVLEETLPDGTKRWEWDGTVDGRKVAAGTYLVAVRSRDAAGNIGTSPSPLPPRAEFGRTVEGKGGISIRYLAAQPPSGPIEATAPADFGVLAAGERYRWAVRRVGAPRARSRSLDANTRSRVRLQAPGGKSGLYLFEVNTATRRVAVPFAVQSVAPSPVLVVLPVSTWQGRNQVDDDGDGLPDTLDEGRPVRTGRIYTGDGIPQGVAEIEGPLLAAIDRLGLRYDITTDVALARGAGPKLTGHKGVVLAGEARWLDPRVQRSLRGFVRDGGTLLTTGPDSLRRSATVTPLRVTRPTPPTSRDLFGALLRSVRGQEGLVLTNVLDEIDLFRGTDGQFDGFNRYEQTQGVGPDGKLVAAASTEDGERNVIVASRFGRGLVLRTGLPEFAVRLNRDPELRTLMRRMWTLLSD